MAATTQTIQKMYIAYFGRPADTIGLQYWADKTEAQIIAGFSASSESQALFGNQGSAAKVNAIYNNLFARDAEPAGLQYWVQKLNSGEVSQAEAMYTILNNAGAGDATAVANKLAAAEAFTAQIDTTPEILGYSGANAAQSAREWLGKVNANAASLDAAKASAPAALAAAAGASAGDSGKTFTLTTALGEQINGTAGNDTINAVLSSTATSSTLNVGDLIDGKAGVDTLKLIVDTAGAVALPVGLQVSNVENIEITNGGTLSAAVDASMFVGATSIKQIASSQVVEKLAATTTAAFQSLTADAAAKVDVKGAADAASVSISLDKVKGDATTNVVSAAVAADATNTTLASVNVAGNIIQNSTTQAANAKAEVQTIDFSTTTAVTTAGNITVGGFTVGLTTAATSAALVAGQVAAAINGQTVNGATVSAAVSGSSVVITYPAASGDVAINAPVAVPGGSTLVFTGTLPAAATETTKGVAAVAAAPAASLALNVALGKDVQSATVNTAVKSTLTIENAAGSTKNLTSVDASASAGDITYTSADAQVATIKTGAGKDTVTLATALDATTKAASVATGAGDDILNVTAAAAAAVTGGTTVAVDAGEGKDTINLTIGANTVYDVKAGAGDDTVVITAGTVKTTDKIDGGDGMDIVSLAGKTSYLADDYIVVNKVLTGFETLKLTGVAVTDLDAAKLASSFSTLDLFTGSVVDNVSTQALIANGALTAEAAGYKSATENAAAGGTSTIVYAGSLKVTDKGLAGAADAIVARAETVNLTIEGGKANGVLANNAVLTGEAKTVNVTLSAGTDTKSTATDTSDDTFVASQVTIAQGGAASTDALKAVTSLTLSGNGKAIVDIGAAAADFNLVSVDASALNSVNEKGAAVAGLVYTSFNSKAETIKLGAGLDTVTLNASTYGKVDTITGLNLVLNNAKTAVDTTKGDSLIIGNFGNLTADGKMTTTQTDLDLALKDAAAYQVNGANVDQVAFHFGGDTYLFSDKGTNGSLDASDIVVKLVGTVDLDTLVVAV